MRLQLFLLPPFAEWAFAAVAARGLALPDGFDNLPSAP